MQAVKWRIAFFYFDMNIFQIRICLAETFDRSPFLSERFNDCLLYTSDAADEEDSVDLGGRGILKKKRKKKRQEDISSEK